MRPEQFVRHARAQETIFERTRLEVRTEEYRNLFRLPTFLYHSAYLMRNPVRFIFSAPRHINNDGLARGAFGRRIFLFPIFIFFNNRIRCIHQIFRRTIIALENNRLRVRVCFIEIQNVFHVCTAPSVYRLVTIANNEKIFMFLREQTGKSFLQHVRILILVDMNVTPAILREHANVGVFLEHPERKRDKIVKVENFFLFESLLIPEPCFRSNARAETTARVFLIEFANEHSLAFCARNATQHRARRELLRSDIERFERSRYRFFGIVPIVHAEEARQTNSRTVRFQ